MTPWPKLILISVILGFLTALIMLIVFPLVAWWSGWFRRTLAVQAEGEPEAYLFAVKDVEGWLTAIYQARTVG